MGILHSLVTSKAEISNFLKKDIFVIETFTKGLPPLRFGDPTKLRFENRKGEK
ncbi:hypothetical protein [Dokdonia sp. Asnod3-C12]|uniref:hypothetical protein n=1 Tax=Dokdonia sp. Asnod3-C12 TaxID=3160575 RepID=UPI00386BC96A